MFNGLDMNLSHLPWLSNAKSRSVSAENLYGEKGKGGMAETGTGAEYAKELGKGWKISPSVKIAPGETFCAFDIEDTGCIQHMWFTAYPNKWKKTILRIYWDQEELPSVEVPLGDFFCNGWGVHASVNSMPISVNPSGGMNSYFPMPFQKGARIELENRDVTETILYYQIDYILTEIEEKIGYFHAQFRRSNPVQDGIHVIVDNIQGKGQYVGTYMAIQVNNNGWWGEGEIKFYMDGDEEYPTICGTGTEDYFGGAWGFEDPKGSYCTYTTPYLGMPQLIKPDGFSIANTRFGLYRFHVLDPIRFDTDLHITIQDLGWRDLDGDLRYLVQKNDIATVAYWYQTEPHQAFPCFPSKNDLEVI